MESTVAEGYGLDARVDAHTVKQYWRAPWGGSRSGCRTPRVVDIERAAGLAPLPAGAGGAVECQLRQPIGRVRQRGVSQIEPHHTAHLAALHGHHHQRLHRLEPQHAQGFSTTVPNALIACIALPFPGNVGRSE